VGILRFLWSGFWSCFCPKFPGGCPKCGGSGVAYCARDEENIWSGNAWACTCDKCDGTGVSNGDLDPNPYEPRVPNEAQDTGNVRMSDGQRGRANEIS
jgi:hypothetical protein